MRYYFPSVLVWILMILLADFSGCTCSSNGNSGNRDSGSDADIDADSDVDADTDSDGDSDSDSDADTDTDSDADSDADSDSDGDLIPTGCEVLTYDANDWMVERAFFDDKMVWGNHEALSDQTVVRARTLSSGDTEDVTSPGIIDFPVIFGDWIYWTLASDGSEVYSIEIYRRNLISSETQQLTDTATCYHTNLMPGESKLIYKSYCLGYDPTYYVMNLSSLESEALPVQCDGNPGGWDFDGVQWFVCLNEIAPSQNRQYKYDVASGTGPTLVESGVTDMFWPKIHGGKSYSGARAVPYTSGNYSDIHVHDLNTGENSYAVTAPWDQMLPSTHGHVLAYSDTTELEEPWFNDQTAHLMIFDHETGVTRQVTEVAAPYYGVARHDKYLAYLISSTMLVLCDLEEGGLIDSEGHVCPEAECITVTDAGVDGGK